MIGRVYPLSVFLILLLLWVGECAGETRIAILDSGCNIEYEEGVSFVDDSPTDQNGHGTIVAKIIREGDPDAKLYIAKVFSHSGRNLDASVFVKALQWAVSRSVDVINLSWQLPTDQKIIHEAIQDAYRHGAVIVAAAGNKGGFIDVLLDELSKRGRELSISSGIKYPARYKEVIAVGAASSFWRFSRRDSYSPTGAELEFVCSGSYKSRKGTSFAAARATAIIAKIKADRPQLGGVALRKSLRFYAHDLGDSGRDAEFGFGRLEYRRLDVVDITPTIILANANEKP